MKVSVTAKSPNLAQLRDELVALPGLAPQVIPDAELPPSLRGQGVKRDVFRLSAEGDTVTALLPDEVNPSAVEAAMKAHTSKSTPAPADLKSMWQKVKTARSETERSAALIAFMEASHPELR